MKDLSHDISGTTTKAARLDVATLTEGDTAEKRRAFIREWMNSRQGKLSLLGAGSLLFLPLLGAGAAQAQVADGLVAVNSINGVQSAVLNPDGSLQVTLANGQVTVIAASEVAILPNGAIAISAAAAEVVAGLAGLGAAVGAGTIAAVAGGVAAAAGIASAVGGSDSGAAAPPVVGGGGVAGAFNPLALNAGGVASLQNFAGFAPADSIVRITLNDAAGNPINNPVTGDPFFQAITDGNGDYSVPIPFDLLGLADGEYELIIQAFTDDGTGQPDGAALGSQTVTLNVDTAPPTLDSIDTPISGNDQINIAESQSDLVITGTSSGAEDGAQVVVNLGGVDHTGTVTGGTWSVTIPASALQALPDGPATVQVTVFDLAGNSATGGVPITIDLTPPTIDIDAPLPFGDFVNLGDSGSDQTITGTTGGALNRQVTLTVTDANGNATNFTGMTDAVTGAWSIDIPFGTLQTLAQGAATLSATVTDDFANPPAAAATAAFSVDTIPPTVAVTAIADDGTINIAEQAGGFTVSGTSDAEAGQLVTVIIDGVDSANTGAVQPDGTWTVAITPAEVAGLADGVPAAIAARVEDQAGNSTTSAPIPAPVDLTPPTITVTQIGDDGFINFAEQATDGITVTGTTNAEDGRNVEVTLTQGAITASVTVQAAGGAFSAPFAPADLGAFTDGPITATAEVTNLVGNTNTSAPFGAVVDLIAPTITIDNPLLGAGNTFTKFNELNGVNVTGTTDAEPAQTVTVTFGGVDYTGAVVDGAPGLNTFSVPIPAAAFAGVDTGDTITGITARVNDLAGNPSLVATAPDLAVDVDGPSISINQIAGDGVVNIAERDDPAGIEISGIATGADGETVTVRILDAASAQVFMDTGVVAAGTGAWSVTILPPAAWLLNDATFTVTADVNDFQGVAAPQATRSFNTDFNNPTIAIDALPFGAFLNALDTESEQVISGTSTGANDRQVTLTLIDGGGNVYFFDGMTDATTGNWSIPVPTGTLGLLNEGTATLNATVNSPANNPPLAPATTTFDVDTVPPGITITAPAFGDFLNAAEAGVDQTINGTAPGAEPGRPVTVTLTDSAGTVMTLSPAPTVDGAGNWTINADLSGLAEGAVQISATVSDLAGNPAAAPATLGFTKDTIAPAVTITAIAEDDIINIGEQSGGFAVTGTTDPAEAGRTVTVTIDGAPGGTALVQADGSWSVPIAPAVSGTLANGTTPEFVASITDAAGNTGNSAGAPATVNLTVPTITFDTLAGDDILNIAESGMPLVVSGTTTAFAANDQIEIAVAGIDPITVSVDALGAFTTTITVADLGALITAAGAGPIAFTATGINDIGNPAAPGGANLALSLTPPTLAIADVESAGVDVGAVINIAERDGGLEIKGSSNAEGRTVTVTVTDGAGFIATATGIVTAGAWQADFTGPALSGLPPATTQISLVADVTDADNNPTTTAPTLVNTDFIAPTIGIDTITSGGEAVGAFLNLAERDAGVTLTGTTDAEDGQIVTVTLSAPGMPDIMVPSDPVAGGAWTATVTPAQLLLLPDGATATWSAAVSDQAGNPAPTPATVTAETAFTPPTVTVDSHAIDGLITGTSTGLLAGSDVTVTVTNPTTAATETYTATVAVDGSWQVQIPPQAGTSNFQVLGNIYNRDVTVAASATDQAGNPGSSTSLATVYRDPGHFVVEASRTATTVTYDFFQTEDRAGEEILLFYDENLTTFDSFMARADFAAAGVTVTTSDGLPALRIGLVRLFSDPGPITDPIISLTMSFDGGDSDILVSYLARPVNPATRGGAFELFFGSSGDDVITVASVASTVRGLGGDDTIDLSAGGRNTVVFELDQASNGTDTITGFEVGPTAKLPDQISFAGLDNSTLRGAGTDLQVLADGGALGTNTGFVVLDALLGGLDAATLQTAAQNLTGEDAGDVIFMLATDGTDSVLARVDYTGVDTASVEILANFNGLDAALIDTTDILGFTTI